MIRIFNLKYIPIVIRLLIHFHHKEEWIIMSLSPIFIIIKLFIIIIIIIKFLLLK